MATFVLVHGAWHGSWCWERVIGELEQRGHRALTVDLPVADPAAGVDEYVAAVADVLDEAGDDAVLVAHSLSGLIAPVVADRHPVARVIYLGAILPVPGGDLLTRLEPGGVLATDFFGSMEMNDDGTASFPEALAGDVFYGDCTPPDRDWAIARLGRQSFTVAATPCPLAALPSVPSDYIVLAEDATLSPAWCRKAAREQLGVEPHELPGDHSPFLSRPAELADLLVALSDG
ncbi:MAG: alpha/beta hydrolase [Acidimicrobiia bacterium]|nr:alpha/beta hydrolase [Acidimicrobiia bacterium]